jgi:hypothetical protein
MSQNGLAGVVLAAATCAATTAGRFINLPGDLLQQMTDIQPVQYNQQPIGSGASFIPVSGRNESLFVSHVRNRHTYMNGNTD